MAPSRVRGKAGVRGRKLVAIILATFLFVTTSIVWRRSHGSEQARVLHTLGSRRAELEAERAQLEGEISRATSQVQLAPLVRALGMRVPSDSQVILLPRPATRNGSGGR
jgi:hypothetical protein